MNGSERYLLWTIKSLSTMNLDGWINKLGKDHHWRATDKRIQVEQVWQKKAKVNSVFQAGKRGAPRECCGTVVKEKMGQEMKDSTVTRNSRLLHPWLKIFLWISLDLNRCVESYRLVEETNLYHLFREAKGSFLFYKKKSCSNGGLLMTLG